MVTNAPRRRRPKHNNEPIPSEPVSDIPSAMAKRAIDELQLPELDSIEGMYEDVRRYLKSRVIGQDEAIDAVIAALDRQHARTDERPIASMLFLGPTGVGKTEVAKALVAAFAAEGMTSNLVTIDCTSLANNHTAQPYLLGSPAGYVGYKDPPILAGTNFAAPYSNGVTVLLIDEVEKADTNLHKVLMPLLDEGRVRLMSGDETSFANTIVIATSNVGAAEMNSLLSDRLGFSVKPSDSTPPRKEVDIAAKRGLKEHFKHMPEFLGRFGEPVVFQPHTEATLIAVFDSLITKKNAVLRTRSGIEVAVSEAARGIIVADALRQNHLGARPVVHGIDNRIFSALGRYIGSGHVSQGCRMHVRHASELASGVRANPTSDFVYFIEKDESLLLRSDEPDKIEEPESMSAEAE